MATGIPNVFANAITAQDVWLDQNFQAGLVTFATIATLRTNTSTALNQVYVDGWSSNRDGGEGVFILNSTDTTTSDNGGTIIVDAVGQRWYRATGGLALSVKWFGAKGDNATDDTAAIQSAIAAAQTLISGIGANYQTAAQVYFPVANYKASGIILQENVALVGQRVGTGSAAIVASATGVVIDTPSFNILRAGVIGLQILGGGSANGATGIRFQNVSRGRIEECVIANCANQGILWSAGSATRIIDNYVYACVQQTSQAGKTGCIDIGGTDGVIERNEASVSYNAATVTGPGLNCVAFSIRGAPTRMSNNLGESSDMGFWFSGASQSQVVDCMAQLNYGHGFFLMNNSGAQFTGCTALSNSQDTSDTYNGFIADVASTQNIFTGCRVDNNTANITHIGFVDQNSDATRPNIFNGCYVNPLQATTMYSINSTSNSSLISFPDGGVQNFAANVATPNVTQRTSWKTNNNSGTTITNFVSGVPGQSLYVIAGDSNTTVSNNANIITSTGANKALTVGRLYAFKNLSGTWYELVP